MFLAILGATTGTMVKRLKLLTGVKSVNGQGRVARSVGTATIGRWCS
jgi:hypothetical protein